MLAVASTPGGASGHHVYKIWKSRNVFSTFLLFQILYRLACRSGHMVGLGSFLSSFCRNRVGEIAVKRKFQASNLELFKTFIGARLENLIKRASIPRTYHDDNGEFDLN